MKNIIVLTLLGALSIASAEVFPNEAIVGKLERILSRNNLLEQKEALVKNLKAVDQEIIEEVIAEEQLTQLNPWEGPLAGKEKKDTIRAGSDGTLNVARPAPPVDGEVKTLAAGSTAVNPAEAKENPAAIVDARAEYSRVLAENIKVITKSLGDSQKQLVAEKKANSAATVLAAIEKVVASKTKLLTHVTESNKVTSDLLKEENDIKTQNEKQLRADKKKLLKDTAAELAEEASLVEAVNVDQLAYLRLKTPPPSAAALKKVEEEVSQSTIDSDAADKVLADIKRRSHKRTRFLSMVITVSIGMSIFMAFAIYYVFCKKEKIGDQTFEGGDDQYSRFVDEELSS